MNLSKLKLGTKLGAGFGVVLLLLTVVVFLGMEQINNLHRNVTSLQTRILRMVIIYEISNDYGDIARSTRNIALTGDAIILEKLKEQYKTGKEKLNNSLDKLETTMVSSREKELFAKIKDALVPLSVLSDNAIDPRKTNRWEAARLIVFDLLPAQTKFLSALDEFVVLEKRLAEDHAKQATRASTIGRTITIVAGSVALILGVLIAFFLTRSISGHLHRVIAGLTDASDQVASASAQAASSSQSLADGTAEQAASLEETSSSLEEISSMTKQNAGNATQAKFLMGEARNIVDKVDEQMNSMSLAVKEVTKSSEETRKIIKSINEIAFQTNLLALNAAVEAARAGEAGAGFAVVAGEVRKLAMLAAEAANNTSNLIENTITTFGKSGELMQRTQKVFKENVVIYGKISNIVDEIEAASQEQARGISHVSLAVADMDNVVQSVAASAEESASAAEEMNAQADNLKDYVMDLAKVIGGTNGNTVFNHAFHDGKSAVGKASSGTESFPALLQRGKGKDKNSVLGRGLSKGTLTKKQMLSMKFFPQ